MASSKLQPHETQWTQKHNQCSSREGDKCCIERGRYAYIKSQFQLLGHTKFLGILFC